MTFSIIATDPITNQIGYAVASKAFYVGIIGFSQPGLGAIHCQGETNFENGPTALKLLKQGKSLQETVQEIKSLDASIEYQQLGLVDYLGNAFAFTGEECSDWAGHKTKKGVSCQGNILTGPKVIDSMLEAYESTEGMMIERLMAALQRGDKTGGDKRGKQSASIKVVSPGQGFMGSDVVVDLNIYDHVDPVDELARVTDILLNYINRR
ncbi:DUF1028 domain-containing protein [archaeon]|nr:DUF1028 domain-containing protein [archaeon]